MQLERIIDNVQREGCRGGVVEGEHIGCHFAGPWRWGQGKGSFGRRGHFRASLRCKVKVTVKA